MTTLARPCLSCGVPVFGASRCAACTPRKAKTDARGLGALHQRLARECVKAQPWCTWCGTTGTPDNPLTGGHIIARADGGRAEPSNYRTECRRCGSRDGGRIGARRQAGGFSPGTIHDPPVASQRVTQPGPVVA